MLDIKRFVDLLETNNISQRELSNRIGVTEATISRYIKGTRQPTSHIISEIAKALDVSSDYLLGNVIIINFIVLLS